MEVGQDMKILILGGYGVFGGRLIELLSALPQLEILVAGRSAAKAQGFIDHCNRSPTGFAEIVSRQTDVSSTKHTKLAYRRSTSVTKIVFLVDPGVARSTAPSPLERKWQ